MTAVPVSVTAGAPAAPGVWSRLARALSPVERRPAMVDGVEAVRGTTRKGWSFVLLRHPSAGTYVRVDPDDYELIAAMDGARTVRELVAMWFDRHRNLAGMSRVTELVRVLGAAGFLRDQRPDAYERLRTKLSRRGVLSLMSRVARGYVKTKVPIPGVGHRLDRWYRSWGRHILAPLPVAVGSGLIVVGMLAVLVETGDPRFTSSLTHVDSPMWAVGAEGFLLVGLLVHELGHAFAVLAAGRMVTDGGVIVFYGLVGAYVNTSDIWMASRRQRVVVSMAGPWAQAVVGATLAIVAYTLAGTGAGTALYTAAVVMMITALLSLVPLVELDGYYALVDIMESPMLRARSLAFVRGPMWNRIRLRQRLTRSEVGLAVFGIGTVVFGVVLVALSVRIWQELLYEPLRRAWAGGAGWERAASLVVGSLVAIPIVAAAVQRLRHGASQLRAWSARRHTRPGRRVRDAAAALYSVPFLTGMAPGQIAELARRVRRTAPARGAEVVRQGDTGDEFFIIGEGSFEVVVDGVPQCQLGPGDYFGERALLGDGRRAATVRSITAGVVFVMDRATFHDHLATDRSLRSALELAVSSRTELVGLPLFDGLAPVELDLLLSRFATMEVGAGVEVITAGDPGDRFYVVQSGRLQALDGDRVVASLGPGEAFGEIALVTGAPRTASVRATEPSELLYLERTDFHDVLSSYCGRATALEQLSHLRLDEHRRFGNGATAR